MTNTFQTSNDKNQPVRLVKDLVESLENHRLRNLDLSGNIIGKKGGELIKKLTWMKIDTSYCGFTEKAKENK